MSDYAMMLTPPRTGPDREPPLDQISSHDTQLPQDVPTPMRQLIMALDAAGVRYCHWKSNIRLQKSLAGGEDLDLLIHRADAAALFSALSQTGFKLCRSTGGIDHPGIIHALALDDAGQKLLHVHAYFQILTGDSLAKSYRIPIEEALLAEPTRLYGIPVPDAAVELAVFVLRVLLKHGALSEIALINRDYDASRSELVWLSGRADWQQARAWLCRWMPAADPALFDRAYDAVSRRDALLRRGWLARRLEPDLRGFRRISAGVGAVSRWRRLFVLALGRFRRRRDLQLVSGGMIVAMVGPKAVGKSTLGRQLRTALGQHLDVRQVHVGKPPATLVTALPHLVIPLARKLFPRDRSRAYEALVEAHAGKSYSLLYVLRITMLSYERQVLLGRCWRAAAAGAIVVTDRYPSLTIGAMDSGQFDDTAVQACRSPLKKWLMKREQALCRAAPQPGVVLRLRTDIGTTVQRDAFRNKVGGPDGEAVRRRWARETIGDFGATLVFDIDTSMQIEDTSAEVVRRVWAAL